MPCGAHVARRAVDVHQDGRLAREDQRRRIVLQGQPGGALGHLHPLHLCLQPVQVDHAALADGVLLQCVDPGLGLLSGARELVPWSTVYWSSVTRRVPLSTSVRALRSRRRRRWRASPCRSSRAAAFAHHDRRARVQQEAVPAVDLRRIDLQHVLGIEAHRVGPGAFAAAAPGGGPEAADAAMGAAAARGDHGTQERQCALAPALTTMQEGTAHSAGLRLQSQGLGAAILLQLVPGRRDPGQRDGHLRLCRRGPSRHEPEHRARRRLRRRHRRPRRHHGRHHRRLRGRAQPHARRAEPAARSSRGVIETMVGKGSEHLIRSVLRHVRGAGGRRGAVRRGLAELLAPLPGDQRPAFDASTPAWSRACAPCARRGCGWPASPTSRATSPGRCWRPRGWMATSTSSSAAMPSSARSPIRCRCSRPARRWARSPRAR